jgi:hypothetical protein
MHRWTLNESIISHSEMLSMKEQTVYTKKYIEWKTIMRKWEEKFNRW